MSEQTTYFGLPYLMPSQAQKHVTHNEALRMLDALVQISALDRDLATPPEDPQEGDRYIVAPSPTLDWVGHASDLAAWQDGGWAFHTPARGWLAWVADEARLVVFDGSGWRAAETLQDIPLLGVNATADATNRLALSSEASLFDHAGSGHQHKINKAGEGDTASVLFQTGYSGRAEFGLAGDDDWHVKTSADGVAWQEALVADKASGKVRFPGGLEHAQTRHPIASMVMTPGGDGEVSIFRFDKQRSQMPRQAALSGVSGDTLTLSSAVADLFFHVSMRDVAYIRIWNISKTPQQPAWVKWDPATNQLQVTDAAHVAGWAASETIQVGDIAGAPGVPSAFTRGCAVDISPMLQNRLGAVFRQSGLTFKCSVSGKTKRVGLSASADTRIGSFFGGNSLSDGGFNVTMHMVSTTELSPVSNSNLVYIREEDNGADTLAISGISVFGVWA